MLVFILYAVALGNVGMVCFFICYYSVSVSFSTACTWGLYSTKYQFFTNKYKGQRKRSIDFFYNNTNFKSAHFFVLSLKTETM